MSSPLRVLILEDDPDDAELIIRELKLAGLHIDWRQVASEADFVEQLASPIDVILADYGLPGFNALSALAHVRKRELRVPFIVITGILGDEVAVDCIKQGATDYLLKDRLKRLGPAVTRAIEDLRHSVARELAEARARQSQEMAAEILRKANAELEQHVADRTHDLEAANELLRLEAAERRKVEDRLLQSQKMEAIGRLAGGIAHDFNNLLTGVIGSLDMLSRRVEDEKSVRLVRGALASAERGTRLTAQLLAFGRQQALSVRAVDLNMLIGNLEDMFASTLTPAVQVDLQLGPGLWRAQGDAPQLELALLNLIINARDAMPEGGSIIISTRNVAPENPDYPPELPDSGPGYVLLVVQDSGTGMSEDVRAQAFEPFFTTKAVGKGSGLGLSMVYGLSQQLGGTARIESSPGSGTSVMIYLPKANAHDALEGMADETSNKKRPKDRQAGRLLLVDDDNRAREVTADGLRELGFDVIEADSGEGALAILNADSEIDMLVTDVIMPGMSGTALALKTRRQRPELPVMLITGFPGPAQPGNKSGQAFPVLHKPFTASQLARMVATHRSQPKGDSKFRGCNRRSDRQHQPE